MLLWNWANTFKTKFTELPSTPPIWVKDNIKRVGHYAPPFAIFLLRDVSKIHLNPNVEGGSLPLVRVEANIKKAYKEAF